MKRSAPKQIVSVFPNKINGNRLESFDGRSAPAGFYQRNLNTSPRPSETLVTDTTETKGDNRATPDSTRSTDDLGYTRSPAGGRVDDLGNPVRLQGDGGRRGSEFGFGGGGNGNSNLF